MPSAHTWTWQSINPGISVRPPRSTARAPGASIAPSATAAIVSPRTSTCRPPRSTPASTSSSARLVNSRSGISASLGGEQRAVELVEPPRERAGHAGADRPSVDRGDRRDAAEGPGDEGLVGGVDLVEREVPLERGDAGGARRTEDVRAGDAVEAEAAGRGDRRAVADDEEIGRVAAGDEPPRIEHQRLVRA